VSDSRVPLRAASDDARLGAIFERVEETMGTVPNMYRAIGNSPVLLQGWIDFAWSLRADADSGRDIRELAILRVAQLTGSEYVWRSHWKPGLKAGLTDVQQRALHDWPTSDAFDAPQRAVLAATDELTRDAALADDTWAELSAHYPPKQAVEIIMTIAWYGCAARMAAGLGLPMEPFHAKVPGLDETGHAS
jgi:4-carboxymuconolactone decarboxylase